MQRHVLPRVDQTAHAPLIRMLPRGPGHGRPGVSRASAGLRVGDDVANGTIERTSVVRRIPDSVFDVAVPESGPGAVLHGGAIHLRLPPVQEGQILLHVAGHQSDHIDRDELPLVKPHPRLLLDVQRGRMQPPGGGDSAGNDVIVVTVDLGDGDAGVRSRAADHSHTGPDGHLRDAQTIAAGGEAHLPEAEAEQEERDIGDDGHAARRVVLSHLHDTSGHRVLHALLQLPGGRRDPRRRAHRRRPDVAELLHVLADARSHTGDRHVSLRVQLHHLLSQGQGLP